MGRAKECVRNGSVDGRSRPAGHPCWCAPRWPRRLEVSPLSETFDISLAQAHAYEQCFVPALFEQWVPALLDHAGVRKGQRVLDVACGTGVVARGAAVRAGDPSLVTGVDLNPAMIEVAREVRPDIDWRVGDALDLPFGPDEFDAVVCQSALMFFC